MENLDSRLLRNQEEEQGAVQELNKQKRGQEESGGEGDESISLRQRVQAARQALNLKEQAKDKIEEKVAAPARAGTNRLLQAAWKALIPSWGLSSIWINIHVLLKNIFGEKLFCKLGEEWLPPKAAVATGEAGKTVTKSIGLIEVMVLIFVDVIIFFIIVGFVSIISDKKTFKNITGESNKAQQTTTAQPAK